VYLTFGYEAVRPGVVEAFDEHITFAESSYIDHKTELQEFLARSGQSVAYKVLGFSGPPHNREFEIEAVVDGESLGRGFGTSKKRAEQEAASEALHELQSRARRGARRARLRGSRARKQADADAAVSEATEAASAAAIDDAATQAAPAAGIDDAAPAGESSGGADPGPAEGAEVG
jgi:hypothetical protein